MNQWHRTSAGFGIALLITFYIVSFVFDLDLWERLTGGLVSLEGFEFDELLLVSIVFGFVEYGNYSRRKRVNVYGATAGAAQHVLGNLLHGLQMVKVAARESGSVPPDVLALCERLTTEASAQLQALTSVRRVNERSIWQAVTPESVVRDRVDHESNVPH